MLEWDKSQSKKEKEKKSSSLLSNWLFAKGGDANRCNDKTEK